MFQMTNVVCALELFTQNELMHNDVTLGNILCAPTMPGIQRAHSRLIDYGTPPPTTPPHSA